MLIFKYIQLEEKALKIKVRSPAFPKKKNESMNWKESTLLRKDVFLDLWFDYLVKGLLNCKSGDIVGNV